MEDFAALFEDLRTRIAVLEAENETLKAENIRLKRLVEPPTEPEPEALKVFSTVQDIVFEQYPDTPETRRQFNRTFVVHSILGDKNWMPYKHVIVEGLGEVRALGTGWNAEKKRGGYGMPDWYAIANMRVLDVTAPRWGALIQEGDDSSEEDPADQEALIRNYTGGLRYSLDDWRGIKRGKELLAIYLETHKDVGGQGLSRIYTTPVG